MQYNTTQYSTRCGTLDAGRWTLDGGECANHGEDRTRWIFDRVATHVFAGDLFAREREDNHLIANAVVEEVRLGRRSDDARRISCRALETPGDADSQTR